ncbi:hypothetical protein BH11PSE12_BH11PSE12_10740 [soil metagenome]
MIRLLYLSTCCATQGAAKQMLVDILEVSKRNNLALGITGVLVHGGGMFLQILEGPHEQVLRKYVNILDDKRHSESRIVLITTTEERAFPTWSMGLLTVPAYEFQEIQAIINRRHETDDAKCFREVLELFMKRISKKPPT